MFSVLKHVSVLNSVMCSLLLKVSSRRITVLCSWLARRVVNDKATESAAATPDSPVRFAIVVTVNHRSRHFDMFLEVCTRI